MGQVAYAASSHLSRHPPWKRCLHGVSFHSAAAASSLSRQIAQLSCSCQSSTSSLGASTIAALLDARVGAAAAAASADDDGIVVGTSSSSKKLRNM
jgi:disulfide bond formation protein DsbB